VLLSCIESSYVLVEFCCRSFCEMSHPNRLGRPGMSLFWRLVSADETPSVVDRRSEAGMPLVKPW